MDKKFAVSRREEDLDVVAIASPRYNPKKKGGNDDLMKKNLKSSKSPGYSLSKIDGGLFMKKGFFGKKIFVFVQMNTKDELNIYTDESRAKLEKKIIIYNKVKVEEKVGSFEIVVEGQKLEFFADYDEVTKWVDFFDDFNKKKTMALIPESTRAQTFTISETDTIKTTNSAVPFRLQEILEMSRNDVLSSEQIDSVIKNDAPYLLKMMTEGTNIIKETAVRSVKNFSAKGDELRNEFIKDGIVQIILSFIKSRDTETLELRNLCAISIGNLATDVKIAKSLGSQGAITILVDAYKANPFEENITNALIYLSSVQENKRRIVEEGVIEYLRQGLETDEHRNTILLFSLSLGEQYVVSLLKRELKDTLKNYIIQHPSEVISLMAMANLVGKEESEKEAIESNAKLANRMKELVDEEVESLGKSNKIYTTIELLRTLENLSINDDNKRLMVESGILPSLKNLVSLENDNIHEEKVKALMIVSQLAFDQRNHDDILKSFDASFLKSLSESKDQEVSQASKEILFQIDSKDLKKKDKGNNKNGHVMFSYNWNHKPEVLKVKKHLENCGYRNIWIDEEDMPEDIFDGMSSAVENASIVLVFVSQFYKESVNCRREATYASNSKKEIVFVIIEPDYVPSGWLGLLLSSSKYVDLSKPKAWDSSLSALVERVSKFLDPGDKMSSPSKKGSSKIHETTTTSNSYSTLDLKLPQNISEPLPQSMFGYDRIISWRVEETLRWLKMNRLESLIPTFAYHQIKGKDICIMRENANGPDFHKILETYGVPFLDSVLFRSTLLNLPSKCERAKTWSNEQVSQYFESNGMTSLAYISKTEKWTGRLLHGLYMSEKSNGITFRDGTLGLLSEERIELVSVLSDLFN